MKHLTIKKISAVTGLSVILLILLLWKPTVIVYGLQRAGLYAAVALPMALVLGIVHIVNLAHGELMMVAAYLTYFISVTLGLDPLMAMIPVVGIMFVLGMILYQLTIRHTLKAPELNQLLLTFGIAMVLSQVVNLIATSQPRKLSVSYVTASMTVGETSFGIYDFVYTALAVLILIGFRVFLKRTKLGRAAMAVGQNPRGARLVGINVGRTYLMIFALASAVLGIMGAFFLTRQSIFPLVGGPYTMKSFCLVAMAGIGSLPMVLTGSLFLGITESLIISFKGYGGWSHLVFFALILVVILVRSYKGEKL